MPTRRVHVRDHDRRKPHQQEEIHVDDYTRMQDVNRGPPPGANELGPQSHQEPTDLEVVVQDLGRNIQLLGKNLKDEAPAESDEELLESIEGYPDVIKSYAFDVEELPRLREDPEEWEAVWGHIVERERQASPGGVTLSKVLLGWDRRIHSLYPYTGKTHAEIPRKWYLGNLRERWCIGAYLSAFEHQKLRAQEVVDYELKDVGHHYGLENEPAATDKTIAEAKQHVIQHMLDSKPRYDSAFDPKGYGITEAESKAVVDRGHFDAVCTIAEALEGSLTKEQEQELQKRRERLEPCP